MLNDLYILRSGLPIFIQKIANNEVNIGVDKNSLMEEDEQITMISGFFSAISSFANTVGDFGEIKELKMSNNIKFSFFKPEKDDDFLFISSTDNNLDQQIIGSLLRKISSKFFRKYPIIKSKEWSGETSVFTDFKNDLKNILEEVELNSTNLKEKESYSIKELMSMMLSERPSFCEIIDSLEDNNINRPSKLDRRFSNKIITEIIGKENYLQQRNSNKLFKNENVNKKFSHSNDSFYNLVPVKRIEQDAGIYDVFSGEDSKKIFKYVDGNHDIESLGQLTGINQNRVFNLCKGFIKMGLISFTK